MSDKYNKTYRVNPDMPKGVKRISPGKAAEIARRASAVNKILNKTKHRLKYEEGSDLSRWPNSKKQINKKIKKLVQAENDKIKQGTPTTKIDKGIHINRPTKDRIAARKYKDI